MTIRMRAGRLVAWALLGLLTAFIVFCVGWRLAGGRWERVESPSMGTVAPVGTLLWTLPADFAALRPGDFISFHPPGRPDLSYSHRVYQRHADGTITTKGVIPSPDPWRLRGDDVIGKVEMRWRGAGWIVAAAPVLLIGALVIALVWRISRTRWRLPLAIVLGSVVVTIAIVWLRPFVDAEQLAFAPAERGGANATYVGTGLLPIRLASNEQSVVLHDGEVGSVHVSRAEAGHRFQVRLSPAIPWWVWLAMIGICFLPALYSLVIGFPAPKQVTVA